MPIAELVTKARMTECADGLTLGHDFHPVFPTPYSHYIPCPHPHSPRLVLMSWHLSWASLVAQRVRCLPAMQETWIRSLGREDPLGKEMATHSSILAWRIPWTEEPGRLQSMGSQRVRHNWETSLSFYFLSWHLWFPLPWDLRLDFVCVLRTM